MRKHLSLLTLALTMSAIGLSNSPMRADDESTDPDGGGGCASGDIVNIKMAQQVPCKVQIEGNGTFTVGKGRKLVKINMVCNKNGTITRIQASTMGTEWSVPGTNIAAGEYKVSAEIITTDNCGNNEMTTPSAGTQTIDVTIKGNCFEEILEMVCSNACRFFLRSTWQAAT